MTAEADLRARILKAVRQMWPRRLGVLLFGRPASATTGPGHPDLFGIARGRFLALEIKKARAKPQPIQEQRLRELRDCGAYAWIVRTEEQACYAVYWTVKGWTRPMSDQPLDLSDWLLGEEAKPAPAAEFAPNAQEPMPFEPGGGRATDPEDTFKTPVPPQVPSPLFETEATPFDEVEIAAGAPEGANLDDEPEELTAPRWGSLKEDMLRLDKDVRTVGDRVTLIYEKLDTYTAVLHGLHEMMTRLMAMVSDEEPPQEATPPVPEPTPIAPRQRRSRKKKEFEMVSEPEPPVEASANGSDLSTALEEIFPS